MKKNEIPNCKVCHYETGFIMLPAHLTQALFFFSVDSVEYRASVPFDTYANETLAFLAKPFSEIEGQPGGAHSATSCEMWAR